MAWSTALGIVLAFVVIVLTVLSEGGNPLSLLNVPASIIVFGGTAVVVLIAFPPSQNKKVPVAFMQLFKHKPADLNELIALLVELADKARRMGLLSLQEEEERLKDPFLKKGIQMVVDGTDPDVVRQFLSTDTAHMQERHAKYYGVFNAMGGYSPTLGIIGTIMGLVTVLGHMDDPDHLAGAIATAFLAAFYGVAAANLLWLPIGSKMQALSDHETFMRNIMMEGILSIQAGDNPRLVGDKLEAFLAPAERKLGREEKTGG